MKRVFESVEAFAQDMVTSFYETHIEDGKAFEPEKVYDRYRLEFNSLFNSFSRSSSVADRQREFIFKFFLEFHLDLFRLEKSILDREEVNKFSHGLGFEDYLDLISYVRGIDLDNFANICEEILIKTQENYSALMLKVLGMNFSGNNFMELLKEKFKINTCIDTDKFISSNFSKHLRDGIEIKIYKGKISFLSPFKIPEKIVSVFPSKIESYLDLSGVYHEFGHSLSFSRISSSLDWPFKRLGSYDVSEAYAFLFQRFLEDNIYDELKDAFMLYGIYNLRRNCAGFLAQFGYFSGKNLDIIKHEFEEFMKTKFSSSEFVEILDNNFLCTDLVKADILFSQLFIFYKNKFGTLNLDNSQILEHLFDLMKDGNKFDFLEVGSKIGFNGYNLEPLIDYYGN